jgi:hypothetical protein
MAKKSENTITKIGDFVIKADNMNYILIENGHYTYHATIAGVFEEIFDRETKKKLTKGKLKTMKEIRDIILETKKEINKIMKPFENLEDK